MNDVSDGETFQCSNCKTRIGIRKDSYFKASLKLRYPLRLSTRKHVVAPTDPPNLVRNRIFCCHVAHWIFFCGCMGFCHRTKSDLFHFFRRTYCRGPRGISRECVLGIPSVS